MANASGNGAGFEQGRVVWWMMGIIAVGLTTSISIVYNNLRSDSQEARHDITELRHTCVTRAEFSVLQGTVSTIGNTQNQRSERIATLENRAATLESEVSKNRSAIESVRDFLYTNYGANFKGPLK